jgi:photosystem II stability/assembly factor-like uncharacterized protein
VHTSLIAQWYQQSFPSGEGLFQVRFVNASTGWILGGLGHIYKTTDSGLTWIEQEMWDGGVGALYALNENTVFYSRWFSNTDGHSIRRSTDGGSSWETVDTLWGDHAWYNDFMFPNDNIGFVVGETDTGSGRLFLIRRTTDAGETWNPIWMSEHENFGLDGVSFADASNGWVCSYAGSLFGTTDGGDTWTRISSFDPPMDAPMRDLAFTTPDSGWVVGGIAGNQTIARTTDGGLTWEYSGTPNGSSLREIQMMNSQQGWFVGSVNLPPYVAGTTDGGATWEQQDQVPANFGFESISMVDEFLGWVVGADGALYMTTNGGVTWVAPVEIPSTARIEQNYPNPFNAQTRISYAVGSLQSVVLNVYDVLGREIATLVNEPQHAGSHSFTWDAAGLPSGVYYYRLHAGSYVETRKLVLLR